MGPTKGFISSSRGATPCDQCTFQAGGEEASTQHTQETHPGVGILSFLLSTVQRRQGQRPGLDPKSCPTPLALKLLVRPGDGDRCWQGQSPAPGQVGILSRKSRCSSKDRLRWGLRAEEQASKRDSVEHRDSRDSSLSQGHSGRRGLPSRWSPSQGPGVFTRLSPWRPWPPAAGEA